MRSKAAGEDMIKELEKHPSYSHRGHCPNCETEEERKERMEK